MTLPPPNVDETESNDDSNGLYQNGSREQIIRKTLKKEDKGDNEFLISLYIWDLLTNFTRYTESNDLQSLPNHFC